MLFGIVTGLRDHVGDVGLVFIDGHEDTMPLDVSEDGEAANTEIGLLLGLTGRLLTGGSATGCRRCSLSSWSCSGHETTPGDGGSTSAHSRTAGCGLRR